MRATSSLCLLGMAIAVGCSTGATETDDDSTAGSPTGGGSSDASSSTGSSAGGMGPSSSNSSSSSVAAGGAGQGSGGDGGAGQGGDGGAGVGGSGVGGSGVGGSGGGGAVAGDALWAQGFGDAELDVGRDVGVASNGDIFVTGFFEGTIDFGGTQLTSMGEDDMFVARLDSDGVVDWARSFGDGGLSGGYQLAVDGNDDIVIVGQFTGGLDFGGVSDGIAATSDGTGEQFDTFVAKLDGDDGDGIWARVFVVNSEFDDPHGIAVDSNGDVVFVGEYSGTVDFGSGETLTSAQEGNTIFVQAYVAKLDGSNGMAVFAQGFEGDAPQVPFSVATAGQDIVVGGSWEGTIEFDPGTEVDALDGLDGFVVKLNQNGVHQWEQIFNTADTQFVVPEAVAVDSGGNVIVAGGYTGNVDFGGGAENAGNASDAFIVKFDAAGNFLWDATFGDGSNQSAATLSTDDQDDIIIAGVYEGVIDLGDGDLANPEVTTRNVFIAKLGAANGAHLWSNGYGDADDQLLGACASDDDEAYCIGTLLGEMDFDVATVTSAGNSDAWLAQLAK